MPRLNDRRPKNYAQRCGVHEVVNDTGKLLRRVLRDEFAEKFAAEPRSRR
jgi:hypothetical protein